MCANRCPWQGFKPYKEEDAEFFNGRSEAIKTLLRIIETKTVTVCYAESGVGKSSLINAGLVPNLREQRYIPISIRFNFEDLKDKGQDEIKTLLCNQVVDAIRNAKYTFEEKNKPYKLIWDIPEKRVDVNLSNLWMLLRNAPKVSLSINGFEYFNVYKPFLILDQFEQLLYDSNSPIVIECFFELLKDLVLNDTFSDRYLMMREEKLVNDEEDSFKVLVSLRQEYIGTLDYWCMSRVPMPSLHDNRYSLQPLTIQEAKEVVLPQGYDIFEDVVDNIIEFAKENDAVSSILLSIICKRLYDNTKDKEGGKIKVSEADVERKKESIIKDYYDEQLKKAQNDKESLLSDEIIHQIEDVLVSEEGNRSLLAIRNGRMQGIVFSESIKNTLENYGIIRSESIGANTFVELIHDRVADAVMERKRERKNQKNKEERRKTNYQKFLSRQNPLTIGGRRIWDNKNFSFSTDNSRNNSLQISSNRTDSLIESLHQRINDDGGIEQMFFDKLFQQTSNVGIISLDFNENYSKDGISVFEITTEQIKTHNIIKGKKITNSDIKKKSFYSSDDNYEIGNNDSKNEAEQIKTQIKINEIKFKDSKKEAFYTADGFCGIVCEYDKEGNEKKREYICDGYTSVGISAIKFEYDKYGFPTKAMYYDKDDNLCKHIDGNYGVKIEYDDYGRETRRWFLDENENNAPIYNGVSGLISKYDDKDRVTKQYFIDENGEPIFDNFDFHGVEYRYNSDEPNDLLVSETRFINDKGELCDNPERFSVERLRYDDNGRIIMQSYYNKNGIEVERKDDGYYYSKLRLSYNDLDRIDNIEMHRLSSKTIKKVQYFYYLNGTISECRFYERKNGQKEKRSFSDNYVHYIKYKYNHHGVLSDIEYYDESGKPMNDRNEYSKICISYDLSGYIHKLQYYNLNNERNNLHYIISYNRMNDGTWEKESVVYEIKNNITEKIKGVFNSNSSNSESIKKIPMDKHHGIINHSGFFIKEYFDYNNDYIPGTPLTVRRKYGTDWNIVEELFFDKEDNSPIQNNEDFYGWRNKYDIETGKVCKKIYFGENSKTVEEHTTEEFEEIIYNATCYFDENGKPITCKSGYHKKIETNPYYDDDLCKQVLFFNCENKPCNCADGYHKQLFEDKKDDSTRIVSFFDANLQPVKNNARGYGYHKREQFFTSDGYETCRSFYDEEGRLINVPEGFAKQKCKRCNSFWTLFYYPYEDHDIIRFYDEKDQKVDAKYEINGKTYHAYKFTVPSDWSSFIRVNTTTGKTLYRDWSKAWKCIYTILVPLIIILVTPFYLLKELFDIIRAKRTAQANTCTIIKIAQVFDYVQKGDDTIVSPAKSRGIKEGWWIVRWNNWAYNKIDEEMVNKFETIFSSLSDNKSITLYDPIEKQFINLDINEKQLGLKTQCAQVSEKLVNEMIEKALSLSPNENDVFLTNVHLSRGEYDKAEELYRMRIEIIEKQSEDMPIHELADAYDDLGVFLFQQDRNNEALVAMEHALAILGDDENEAQLIATIHNHLAQVYRDNNEYEKAEQHYKENVKLLEGIDGVPGDVIADRLMRVGVMLARQEKYDECLEVTNRALSLTSEDNVSMLRSIHSNLAYLYKEKGEHEKAEEHYKALIDIMEKQRENVTNHDLADAYDDLGVCLFILKRNDEAKETLERALELVGKDENENQLATAIHDHLAQVYRDEDEYEKAEHHYKENVRLLEKIGGVPGDLMADRLIKVGIMLARQEKYDECLEVTKRALSLTSEDNDDLLRSLHSNLAFLYKEKGKLGDAEEHYKSIIDIMEKQREDVTNHDLADAYDDLGICLYHQNKGKEAEEAMEYALTILGDDEGENQLVAAIHDHLALVYQSLNEVDKVEYHQKARNRIVEDLKRKNNADA